MVLKPANSYQIIQRNFKNVLISDFKHHLFLYWAKVLYFFFIFYGTGNNKLQRGINWPFRHLFTIWFTLAPGKYFIKLCNTRFTVDTQKTPTKVILSMAVPQNIRGAFKILSNIFDWVFLQNIQFITDISKSPNAFKLVYVSCDKWVWLRLTSVFKCY